MKASNSNLKDVSFVRTEALNPQYHEQRLIESRRRSIEQYKLDPDDVGRSRILEAADSRVRQEQAQTLLRASQLDLQQLSYHIQDSGYSVILTDAQGVTVNVNNPENRQREFREAGFVVGACWSEDDEGTCAVGTAIVDRLAILVHRQEHFRTMNSGISCSSAPIFNVDDSLIGILDATALRAPELRTSQTTIFRLVCHHAARIEDILFNNAFSDSWILNLAVENSQHTSCNEHRIALSETGEIKAISRSLRQGDIGQRLATLASLEELLEIDALQLFRLAHEHPGVAHRLHSPILGCLVNVTLRAPPPVLSASSPTKANQTRAIQSVPSVSAESESDALSSLIINDSRVADSVRQIRRLVDANIPIMLTGETGTGKEVFAQAIHQSSNRQARPFVALNCAAIPETLIESELFGYCDGAFTGAKRKGSLGKIQLSSEGTLFLDEIGDMPYELQSRLLRVLAEGEVLPLGAIRPEPVNLSIICATHQDLPSMVKEGSFREDLFYRLNAAIFTLPPLRKRTDLAELIQHIFATETAAANRTLSMSASVRTQLMAHHWSGNIRELKNVVRVAIAICEGEQVNTEHLPAYLSEQPIEPSPVERTRQNKEPQEQSITTGNRLSSTTRESLIQMLRQHHWNASAAARAIGISRSTLYRQMRDLAIVPPNRADTA